jgi:DNA polymerase-1
LEDLEKLIQQLDGADVFAIDTETTAKNPHKARLVGLSVSMEPDRAFYIPCGHRYLGAPKQIDCAAALQRLKPVLENPAVKKVGQNIKYDWTVLARHGIDLAGVAFDTMLASYLLNPAKRAHSLDQIALDFLGHKTTTFSDVAGKAEDGFAGVPIEKAVPYACEDADITLAAFHVLSPMLEADGLTELLETVELPLVPVLITMERLGVCVDRQRLDSLSRNFADQLNTLENRIHSLAGEPFNINSSQQLGHILFEKLKLPTLKRTRKKTGYSTDVDVLTTLAADHELPALVLRHRTLAKLKSTYADALMGLIDPQTGRLHTQFNQSVTATGRLSSSDPNLQNIPIRTEEGREIRRAFVPRKGWKLLSADYSQIELRILAHCSRDRILMEAFERGEDIHTRTAAEVFGIPPEAVTGELRRQAKAINFGIIYGMSAYGLSKQLGISQKLAKTTIDNYFERYQGVKTFIDETIASARSLKRTSTLLGRIRPLPEITSDNRNMRQFAERTAVNTPIQGSAADLIKLAMIQVDTAIRREKLRAAMLLSVHDELVFEVPEKELKAASRLVASVMESVWRLRVPLEVNVAWGDNWTDAH